MRQQVLVQYRFLEHVIIYTGLLPNFSILNLGGRKDAFSALHLYRQPLDPTQYPVQGAPGFISWSKPEVYSGWSYASKPCVCLRGMFMENVLFNMSFYTL